MLFSGRFCVNVPRDSWGHHSGSGNLCSPAGIEFDAELWNENIDLLHFTPQENTAYSQKSNFHSALYHCIMGKRLVLNKGTTQMNDSNEVSSVNIFYHIKSYIKTRKLAPFYIK